MPPGITEGRKAPAFDLPSSGGGRVSLKSLKGSVVVLYFYPKDGTPGCTVEACEFGALAPKFARQAAVVLGVSPDSAARHDKFIAKFKLPFTLLADAEHALCEAYGVWVEKSLYGRKYWGVQRSTFLIDAAGVVRKAWPKVRPEGHAAEVLEAIKEIE
jgi:peroxiredoxin Q/BCP